MEFEGKDKNFLRLYKIYGTKIHNLMEFKDIDLDDKKKEKEKKDKDCFRVIGCLAIYIL